MQDRETAISVKNLKKFYGRKIAVNGVHLKVKIGEVFSLLGPNGAGKTSIVEILEGHRKKTSGEVDVLGFDPGLNQQGLKKRVGIVLQSTSVEPYLTVREIIELFSGYYDNPLPSEQVMDIAGILDIADSKVRKLSGGQQRRLDVAIALSGNPELLFLDEPTTGFDPLARRSSWELVNNLKSLGKTVFLTTHYMDEAEYLSDRVALIVDGKIVVEGSPDELRKGENVTNIKFKLDDENVSLPKNILAAKDEEKGTFSIVTKTTEKTLFDLTAWSIELGLNLNDLTVSKPSLEDIYLKLVQKFEDSH